ncbi:MAG TPA: response regulator [Gemmataceae bacterium]|nr:response regulator [Gemmataceae bacterium]
MNESQPAEKTVLIVENNSHAREALAALVDHRGYKAVTARDGAAALAMLASWVNPGLIILDMLMPGLDGWQFLDALRHSRHRNVPVIITSGVDLTDDWAFDHGCAAFLHKPLDEAELFAAIGRVMKFPDRRGDSESAATKNESERCI